MFKSFFVMITVLSSYLVPASWGFMDGFGERRRGLTYEGQVKAIGLAKDPAHVRVRLKSVNPAEVSQVQVFRLCDMGQVSRNHGRSQLLQDLIDVEEYRLLQEAMSKGSVVQIEYDSYFDRCIKNISILAVKAQIPRG